MSPFHMFLGRSNLFDEMLVNAADNKQRVSKMSRIKIELDLEMLEHILLRPDTYIGSVVKLSQDMWVYDEEQGRIVNEPISYVPGLF